MSAELIIESGVAATRAALVENGKASRFWFGPARGDERLDQSPLAGRKFLARVKSTSVQLNAAFLDIGDGADAFLPFRGKKPESLSEGALVSVVVKSSPRQGKGAVLKLAQRSSGKNGIDDPENSTSSNPGRLPPFEDPVIEAVLAIGAVSKIIHIDDGSARAVLASTFQDREIRFESGSNALFDDFGVTADLEKAFDRIVPLENGARLFIDETQALTAIDVDSGALKAASPARLREKMSNAAAEEAIRQVMLREIGGHVVIDFPSIGDKGMKKNFQTHLRSVLSQLEGAGSASFARSGLYSFTAPHKNQSLQERFTQVLEIDPVSGRQFTLDWLAKSIIREVEHRLRRAPQRGLRILAGEELFEYINGNQVWLERLADRYGPHYEFKASKKYGARESEILE